MKKRLNRLCKRIKIWWKWYVLGYYHCDKCPYCWSEYSYEGDGDCGCYIRGDLWDTCRLLPPFRFLIGWPRKRQYQYHEAHAYDGIGDFWEQQVQREKAYAESVKILLQGHEIYRRDFDGKLIPVCKADLLWIDECSYGFFGDALRYYEDKAHPVIFVPLKQRWKELIRDTWKKEFYERIVPYLPRKKRRKEK